MRTALLLFALLLPSAVSAANLDRAKIVALDEVLESFNPSKDALKATQKQALVLLKQHPNEISLLIRCALLAMHLDDEKKATQAIRKILEADPGNSQALALRGTVAWRAGRIPDAQRDFDTVVAGKPRHPVANNFFAYQAIQEGNFQCKDDATENCEDAITFARKALVGNPRDLNAYALLSYAYHRVGDEDLARLVAISAREISDTFPDMYNLLGIIDYSANQPAQAGKSFQKALELEPMHRAVRMNLAALAMSVSDFGSSLEHLEAASQSTPRSPEILLSIGVSHRGMKNYERAEKAYLQVLSINPDHLAAKYNLCVLKQEHQQDFESALDWCARFKGGITRKHPKWREMRDRVEGLRATIEMMREPEPDPGAPPEEDTPTDQQ
jgi:predicted Zn-dependent protease